MTDHESLESLLARVRACRHCEAELPLGPRPVLSLSPSARVLIIGQAPGTRVHATGIPWNDPSGERLRQWMQVERGDFYDNSRFAIVPMGFCYPGKGKGGDLPPRPECAAMWHDALLAHLPAIELVLLIGRYAIARYLPQSRRQTLTETVSAWRDVPEPYLPLPHPSPRNTRWLRDRPWFEAELVPTLRARLSKAIKLTI